MRCRSGNVRPSLTISRTYVN